MGTKTYTRLKGGVTWFRRKVPNDLAPRFGVSELNCRIGYLHTEDASRIGRKLASVTDDLFLSVRENVMLDAAEIAQLVNNALSSWRLQRELNNAEAAASERSSSISAVDQAKVHAELSDSLITAYDANRYGLEDHFVNQQLRACGLPVPSDPLEFTRLKGKLTLALSLDYLDRAIELGSRHSTVTSLRLNFQIDSWRARRRTIADQLGMAEHVNHPSSAKIAVEEPAVPSLLSSENGIDRPSLSTDRPVPAAAATLRQNEPEAVAFATPVIQQTFSELFPIVMGEREARKEIKPGWERDAKSTIKIWCQIVGDKPLLKYSEQDMSNYQQALLKLPKVYWKSKAEREKPILQIIQEAQAANPDYDRVASKTANRHLSMIVPFLKACRKTGRYPKEAPKFWEEFHLNDTSGREAHEDRPAYSNEQIVKIFKHPIFTGRRSKHFYNQPGDVIIRDALYYSFLIAAFHPMRRAEFCQLKVRHVRQKEAEIWNEEERVGSYMCWCFDLTDKSLRIKRDGHRTVPLHQEFLKTNFLAEFVRGRGGNEFLFEELVDASGRPNAETLGKRASRVIDSLGIVLERDDGTAADGVFHPLRHTTITKLDEVIANKSQIDALSGHKMASNERKRYVKPSGIHLLKETIDQLRMPIGVERLNAAYDERLK